MEPIGRILRRQKHFNNTDLKANIVSIDDRIAKLENELAKNNDSNSDNDIDDEVESCDELIVEKDSAGQVFKLVSSNTFDRIDPLPQHLLPLPMCTPANSKKRKKIENTNNVSFCLTKQVNYVPSNSPNSEKKIDKVLPINERKGLEATVREMLRNYKPSSIDKKPFWCRSCSFQGKDLEGFQEHQTSVEHVISSQVERAMSKCKLCKKEFTSPAQLKEHLNGSSHKEKLINMKNKQMSARKFT